MSLDLVFAVPSCVMLAQPDWWALKEAGGTPAPSAPAQQDNPAVVPGSAQALLQAAAVGAWAAPYVEGARRPPPRYEHAVAELGGHMYVVGGNCGAPPQLPGARLGVAPMCS